MAAARHRAAEGEGSEGELWRFAVGLYGRPGVAPACLLLQDRLGVDVSVLLFSLFALHQGCPLGPEDIADADAAVRDWRADVVVPLRRVRTRLKSGPQPAPSPETDRLRQGVKGLELQAEQIELAMLANWFGERKSEARRPQTGPASAVRDVVSHYARALATRPPHAEVLGDAEPRSTQDRSASFEAPLRGAPQDEDVVLSGSEPAIAAAIRALTEQAEAFRLDQAV